MKKIIIILSLSLMLAACSAVPVIEPQGPDTVRQTQVALAVEQTIIANQQQTQAIETEVAAFTPTAPLPTNTPQPTETPTNTPENTPTITPTFTPAPTLPQGIDDLKLGSPDASYNFNNKGAFYTYSDATSMVEVKDGTLQFTIFEKIDHTIWSFSSLALQDFYFEISVRMPNNCKGKDRGGIIFGTPVGKTDEGLNYQISCDGQYRLFLYDGNESITLVPWSSSSELNSGPGKTNKIGVIHKGDTIAMYINGKRVHQISDDTYVGKGRIGINMGVDDHKDVTIYFDDAAYWTNTTPTSSVSPTTEFTKTPVTCNWAGVVKDMTVADGTQFPADARFTKVWRLKNIGSCTWTTNYSLVFEDGRKMGGSSIPLPKKVAPGETVDIALPLKAPAEKGTYKGNWILTDAKGKKFGIGSGANKPIFVQIQVAGKSTPFAYDLAANFWTATWKTDKATLYVSGTSEGFNNYVLYTNTFRMESGKWEDEPAIIVNVESEERVRGIYPSYLVKPGDRFVSQIGCIYDNPNCKVKMVLAYQVKGSDDRLVLGEWRESLDGNTTVIDIDLSSLAGKDVIFILDMEAKSQSKTNEVFWFLPSIRNP